MSKFANRPLLDDATLDRMKMEFDSWTANVIAAGEPIDPTSDPFGANYAWLDPDPRSTDFEEVYSLVLSQPSTERRRIASATIRRTALTGTLAGATDDQVFQQWLGKGFVGLCHRAGPTGVELLANIRKDTEVLPERVQGVLTLFLETFPKNSFTMEESITLATAIIHALKAPG